MQALTNFLEVATITGDFKQIGQWGLQVRRGEAIPGGNQSDAARFSYDFNRDPNDSDYRNAALSGASGPGERESARSGPLDRRAWTPDHRAYRI